MKSNRLKTALKRIYKLLLDEFGPQNWWPGETEFEICVGAILTQNTNWSNVERAISNLKSECLMNASALKKCTHRKLASLIKPAGYFNVKTKRLRAFLESFFRDYGGSIKRMKRMDTEVLREELLGVYRMALYCREIRECWPCL